MTFAALVALALLARTAAAERGHIALELTGGAHMKRAKVHQAHEIAAVKVQIRELQQRVDQLEVRELQDQVRAHQAHETAASQDRVRELQDQIRELQLRGLDVREKQEATNQTTDTAADTHADGATANATATQSGPSELPKADALRELLDENNGPVVSSMKAADESAATLLDSAKEWKQAGEDIKKEFEESVQKEVVQTGKTLEEEHGGVKQEADEKPKKVLEELKQKHAASAPGGSSNSSALELGPPCRGRGRVDWVVRSGGNGVRRALAQQLVDWVKDQFADKNVVGEISASGTGADAAVNTIRITADAEGTAGGIHDVVEAVQSHWGQITEAVGNVVEACL